MPSRFAAVVLTLVLTSHAMAQVPDVPATEPVPPQPTLSTPTDAPTEATPTEPTSATPQVPLVPTEPLPPLPKPAPRSVPAALQVTAYSLIGVGVASLVTGSVFAVLANVTQAEYRALSVDQMGDPSRLAQLAERGTLQTTLGNVFFVSGALVLGAGVVLALFTIDPPAVSVVPTAGGASVAWSGRF